MQPAGVDQGLVQFQRNVDAAGPHPDPVAPCKPAPEPVRFGKAHQRIDHGRAADGPQAGVVGMRKQGQEDGGIAAGRIDMQALDDGFRERLGVAVQQCGQAQAGHDHQQALGGLEQCDTSQPHCALLCHAVSPVDARIAKPVLCNTGRQCRHCVAPVRAVSARIRARAWARRHRCRRWRQWGRPRSAGRPRSGRP
ncbi:hypothetical protein D3C72_1616250 [compost metagenome]